MRESGGGDARRRHQDVVSKKMGDLLLKGYKMLGSSCETCSNVLLQDKAGSLICVSCDETKASLPAPPPAPAQEKQTLPEPFAKGLKRPGDEIRDSVREAMRKKLDWALQRLETNEDVDQCCRILDLIDGIVRTANAVDSVQL